MKKIGWYILAGLVAFVGITVVVASLGKVKLPFIDLGPKFRAIDAETAVKKLEKEQGKERALAAVEAEFAEAIARLSDEEKKEHARLKDDPVKLARLLAGKKV